MDEYSISLRASEELLSALEQMVPTGTIEVRVGFARSALDLLTIVGDWAAGVITNSPDGMEAQRAMALHERIDRLGYRLGEQTTGAIR